VLEIRAETLVGLNVKCRHCCLISTKIGMCEQTVLKRSSIRYHENSSTILELLRAFGLASEFNRHSAGMRIRPKINDSNK
jgi:hypothetical protein